MKRTNIKIDESRVKEMSYRNKERAEFHCTRSMAYLLDQEKDKRLLSRLCAYCFYLHSSSLAGQAFTEWNCGVCDKEQMHSNTATPVACSDCSTKHSLCVQCGCDLHMRSGRPTSIK